MIQYLISLAALLVCSITDLRFRKISRAAAAVYFVLAAAAHLLLADISLPDVLPGLLPGLACLLLSVLTEEAIGYGDGILVVICGFSLGVWQCLGILMLAFMLAGLFGVMLLVIKKGNKKSRIAFVPFLLLGTLIQFLGM